MSDRPALPRARKRFGQHFLEATWVDKLVRAIAPGPTDVFLEIGPGRGAITRPLVAAAGRVIAFEIDRDLAAALQDEALPNLTVVEGDFLRLSDSAIRAALTGPDGALPASIRVAGNLPYNVASPILFRLAALHAAGLHIADATVMLQREVADRLLASPGSKDYSVLTVLTRLTAHVRRVLQLPPGAFRPPPRVHSAVVQLTFHSPEPPVLDPAAFARLTQSIFSQRRKTLANALRAYPASDTVQIPQLLAELGIDPARRPETLSMSELVQLSDRLSPSGTAAGPML